MFNIGFSEILLVLIIALLVLGPKRLPEAARVIGRCIKRCRQGILHLQKEIQALELSTTKEDSSLHEK